MTCRPCAQNGLGASSLAARMAAAYTPPKGYVPPGTDSSAVHPESKGVLYIGLGLAAIVLGAGAALLFSEEK